MSSNISGGVDMVNLQRIRTGLREGEAVNCESFKPIVYSQSGNLLTETLECSGW